MLCSNLFLNNTDFYERCSKEAKENYNTLFVEDVYTYNMKQVMEKVMS